ncbi:MAG: LPS-assembly protein LptD [Deferribacterales bacterium]
MKKLLILLLIPLALTAFAAEDVIIEADNVDSSDQNVYHAEGNVKIFQGEKTMLADEVFYYKDRDFLRAVGNVRLTEEMETIDCSEMEYNTEDQTGVFYNANAFMEPFSWFKAKTAYKTGVNSYTLKKASYTTCSGDSPAWSITSTSAKLDVGGYLSAFNVAGWAQKVPVFYSPYIIYPVKTERESGFLIPKFGVSSKTGAFVQPRYFWNIDVDKDTTFGAMYTKESSPLYSNEFRFTPTSDSSFYNYFEYINTDYDAPQLNEAEGNVDRKTGRYFIYNDSDFRISDNLRFSMNIEAVSDYSYQDDYENFSLLKDYTNDDENYTNNLQLAYTSKYANVTLKYNDIFNYTVSSLYSREHTIMRPTLAVEQDITDYPVYFRYYASYDDVKHTRFDYAYADTTEEDKELTYTRNHFNFAVYKPFNLYLGTYTPELKVYYTKWYDIDSNYDLGNQADQDLSGFASLKYDGDTITRQTYAFKQTFALKEISRNYKKFKHSIYNTFSYIQTPNIESNEEFDYAYEDYIETEKKYDYTLQNYFRAKNWSLKLENTQGYEMTRDEERLEPLITKIDYNYFGLLWMSIEDDYNYYDSDTEFLMFKTSLTLGNVVLSTNYTYDKYTNSDQNTTLKGKITFKTKKFDVSYTRTSSGWNSKVNLKTDSSIDDSLSVSYKSECWQIGVIYNRKTVIDNIAYSNDSTTESTILLTLGLRGLD